MRFIGSKNALLENIEYVINENTEGNEHILCDLFSGTAVVAQHFKNRYKIISNDFMYFSYVIQKAVIENNKIPKYENLKKVGVENPYQFLEESVCSEVKENFFITKNYSPYEDCKRMYLSVENAIRIDYIRNMIESWKDNNLLTEEEYFHLLAGLVEGVPYVSNITGTYGAYLKDWDKRAYKNFEMVRLNVENNGFKNECYNENANNLISEIQGDILYLDPPYNTRQYAPNYHLLETISQYDYPEIKGVTGMRNYDGQKSDFCKKSMALIAFEDIIKQADFENIVVSYSNEGVMKLEEIEKVLKKYGIKETYKRYDVPYRKYKSKIYNVEKVLYESIFFIKKDVKRDCKMFIERDVFNCTPKPNALKASGKKYIKSPLNYIGGKHKLLPQIIPLFPKDIDTFVDLFSGGANVGINVNANKVIFNDINTKIIEMFESFKSLEINDILKQIDFNIKSYQLSKTNEEGFLNFRNKYNEKPDPIDLYTLACYSFNYQFRFNNRHKYNNPFGRNRSQFSERMKENLISFVSKLKSMNTEFFSKDFMEIDLTSLNPQDFVYCDPPYLITVGTYNDGKRGFKNWSEEEEEALYCLLDDLNKRNIRFAFSNVIKHKGQTNEKLLKWSEKYKVVHLNSNYANSSYNTKREESDEVLIMNY